MIQLKNQLSRIVCICLISFIGLLFMNNNNRVMAMNQNNVLNQIVELNKKLNEELEEQNLMIAKALKPEFDAVTTTEDFLNQVKSLSASILNIKEKIYILTERQIIDEKTNTFINQRNDAIIELVNSQGDIRAQNIINISIINRQISCLSRKENRFKAFIQNRQYLFNNQASTSITK
ncbi:SVM family protein [Candidatus Phytoplasma fraxini]|uniref:SVM family protein n=1 Tax=Ash yellows phytoplasma TaxID=35780 RepID=A0ABZ2U8J4_ASHYP